MEDVTVQKSIALYGEAVLRRQGAVVETVDASVREFIEQMKEVMYQEDGAGLAAPQVHASRQIALVDITMGEQEPYVLINPEIVWASEETEEDEEGCLSIPDIRLPVARAAQVHVRATDAQGNRYDIENAHGLLARALQHEIDHLHGVLFVDRAAPMQRHMVAGKLKKLAKSAR